MSRMGTARGVSSSFTLTRAADYEAVYDLAEDPVVFDFLINDLPLEAIFATVFPRRPYAHYHAVHPTEPAWKTHWAVHEVDSVLGQPVFAPGAALLDPIRALARELLASPEAPPRTAPSVQVLTFTESARFRLAYARIVRDAWNSDDLVVRFPKRRSQL